jgi:hypothetical protein
MQLDDACSPLCLDLLLLLLLLLQVTGTACQAAAPMTELVWATTMQVSSACCLVCSACCPITSLVQCYLVPNLNAYTYSNTSSRKNTLV